LKLPELTHQRFNSVTINGKGKSININITKEVEKDYKKSIAKNRQYLLRKEKGEFTKDKFYENNEINYSR
jgi:hypothetical protein